MKLKGFIFSLLMAPTLILHAHSSMDERVSKLEEEMEEIGKINIMGNFGTSFVTARNQGEKGWFIFLEPLYWHAKVGATEYTQTELNAPSRQNLLFPPHEGEVKHQDFGWNWGLRVGIGRNIKHDEWDINLNYTWYENDDSHTVRKNYPSALLPTRTGEVGFIREAKSSFDLGYNNINLEIGRHYFISQKVSTHPFISLRSTWLDLKQRIQYLPTDPDDQEDESGYVKLNEKTNLWGMGPRVGLNTEWSMGDNFSFAARFSGTLLYSYESSIMHIVSDANTNTIGSNLAVKLRGKSHLFVPTVQFFLGIIWERSLFDGKRVVTLGAGYEAEYFWRANQMMIQEDTQTPNALNSSRKVSVETASEDVMFYGLTLRARLDF